MKRIVEYRSGRDLISTHHRMPHPCVEQSQWDRFARQIRHYTRESASGPIARCDQLTFRDGEIARVLPHSDTQGLGKVGRY